MDDKKGTMTKATHPLGTVIEIVGIKKIDRGRLCEDHPVCGVVVEEDFGRRAREDCNHLLLGD